MSSTTSGISLGSSGALEDLSSSPDFLDSPEEDEIAPLSESELWLSVAKSFHTRNELQGILKCFGENTNGSRANLEARVAASLGRHQSEDYPEARPIVVALLAALPINLRAAAEQAILGDQ